MLITGAGQGIGRSHALLLGSKGASVVVADHGTGIDVDGSSPKPPNDIVAENTDARGQAVATCESVADEDWANSIIDTPLRTCGRVDVIINNAAKHDPG